VPVRRTGAYRHEKSLDGTIGNARQYRMTQVTQDDINDLKALNNHQQSNGYIINDQQNLEDSPLKRGLRDDGHAEVPESGERKRIVEPVRGGLRGVASFERQSPPRP